MQIENAVITITGGAGGLGLAMAEKLVLSKAKIALIDHNEVALDQAIQKLGGIEGQAKSYACDITNESSVESLFESIIADFGKIDALINNAGIIRDGLLIKKSEGVISQKMQLSDWQDVLNVNLTGVFLCGREAAAAMATYGEGGCIINISSISAQGNMGQTNYSATKAGVNAMTVTWSKELSRYGIRTVSIAPGFVRTPLLEDMKQSALAKLESMVPVGRLCNSEEIAQTVKFALENDYLNGCVLEVDGGLRI